MCLPCFPWTWTEYEDPLDSMPEQHVWVHDGQAWSLQRYSPKTPRRMKTGGEPLRQVHFQSPGTTKTTTSTSASPPFSSTSTTSTTPTSAATTETTSNQPESFPQLGAPPLSTLGAGQWHTAVDPTQSVKLPGQPFAGFAPGQHQPAHFLRPQLFNGPFPPAQPQLPTPITYIGHPQPVNIAMADYQNAAPMHVGINFQPPVPDTTFGPIPHVYVPRFDGSYVPAALQVGLPPVQFVSAPAACSVVMPKTFYHNGYTYYAITHPSYVVAQQPAIVPQPFVGQQPVMIGGQPAPAAIPVQQLHAVPAMGVPGVGGVPVIAGNGGQIPDVSGLGRTPAEETVRQLQFAHANKLFEPQEFKPSDDDPSRFYYVREVDGNWTQRNRFTIDHLGDCRWYVTDEGWFYAVRMPN
ncbi:uncharacterized protein TRIVIDRAFT_195091 [Trichoderma virens Gv29-8]|uniref:Uncharacterized protein n=1 Tax=Hypocrea virens (strain Gv29-8 / FGSC 10586) TaxID=413071 RepID=G9N7X3_HYPVG|nr:uncharacterized protein TRIVIDRAFT_195091 [Trichoderma virens Gv29-8]EHK17085.1 hypothetical protein TRIVIDRAFT_195091 [Trichoderma virens Gv29-8]UKZ55499.1 hypothetical protein TrVGV298_009323 [Trichoderma virens]